MPVFIINCYFSQFDAEENKEPDFQILNATFIPQIGIPITIGKEQFAITEIIKYHFDKNPYVSNRSDGLDEVNVLIHR